VAEKKDNWRLKLAAIIVLVSIVMFIFALNIQSFFVLEKQEIPVKVIIGNKSAFNITKDEKTLNLGVVKKGDFSSRNLSITNENNFTSIFDFDVKGNISEILLLNMGSVVLDAKEKKDIVFRTKAIEDEEFGEYSGILIVKVRKFPD